MTKIATSVHDERFHPVSARRTDVQNTCGGCRQRGSPTIRARDVATGPETVIRRKRQASASDEGAGGGGTGSSGINADAEVQVGVGGARERVGPGKWRRVATLARWEPSARARMLSHLEDATVDVTGD